MSNVLIVEDDPAIRDLVSYALAREGMDTREVASGEEALELLGDRHAFDLVIIDIFLPGMDGITLCRKVRSASDVPVVMLTARSSEIDVVVGLEVGADDYITKPFSQRELVSRIRAHLRRRRLDSRQTERQALDFPGLEVDFLRRQVMVEGTEVELTAAQFEILSLLASHPGRVYGRDQLLCSLWGAEPACDSRAADVQIQNIRRKIESDPKNPRYILTVRGVGYRFAEL